MWGALGGRVGATAAGVKEWSDVLTAVPSVSRRKWFSEYLGEVTPGTHAAHREDGHPASGAAATRQRRVPTSVAAPKGLTRASFKSTRRYGWAAYHPIQGRLDRSNLI